MTPTLKRQWLKALRSGEYRQGRGWLQSADKEFCCLGVLCEVAHVKAVRRMGGIITYGGGSPNTPPFELYCAVGVDNIGILVDANDYARWTFAEIADWIEVFL